MIHETRVRNVPIPNKVGNQKNYRMNPYEIIDILVKITRQNWKFNELRLKLDAIRGNQIPLEHQMLECMVFFSCFNIKPTSIKNIFYKIIFFKPQS
jgi:hypothetical protein